MQAALRIRTVQRNPFEPDPEALRNRRAVRLTLAAGTCLLGLGFILALNPFDRAEARMSPLEFDIENVAFTSARADTSDAAQAYLDARAALSAIAGAHHDTTYDTASYFSLLGSMSPVFLSAERESAKAALHAAQMRMDATPYAQSLLAYEKARLAYIDHLLSQG